MKARTRRCKLLVTLTLLGTLSACGIDKVGDAVGNGLATGIGKGIGDAVMPPTSIADSAQTYEEKDSGQFESIFIRLKKRDYVVNTQLGDTLAVRLNAKAQKVEIVENFMKASQRIVKGDRLEVTLGDSANQCVYGYEDNKLKRIDGVCVEKVLITLPRTGVPRIYFNDKLLSP